MENEDRKWALAWEERGRKYRLERRSNEVGNYCSRREGTVGGLEHPGGEI